jgi:hypothetical protein
MISQIRQVRDTRSSASDYAPPWARGADRAREQHFEPANLAVGPRHAVVELTHQLPLEPGRDWQGADRGRMTLRLIALQMGVVSGIAALVAWAFISIFGPKSPANDTVQLRQSPLATTASSVSSAGGESRTELSPANPAPQTTAGPRQTPAGPTAPTMARSLATAAESLVPPAAATTANPTKTPAAPAPSSTARPAQAEAAPAPPITASQAQAEAAPAPPITASSAQAQAAPAPPIIATSAQAEAAPAPTIAASPAQAEAAPAPSAEAARINITAEPAPSQLPSRTETASASASPMATADTGHGLGTDELASLVKRAQGFINAGDFSAARLLLRRAAEAGSAEAALALGATFDPDFLRKSRAVGIDPDVGRARQWYRKAVDLGSPVAAKQLDSLPQAH